LEGYTDKNLSQQLLDNISNDFDAAREAGMKLILRFCYTVTANSGTCPEGLSVRNMVMPQRILCWSI
jgi:hypothetical protein